ncbi:Hypothetical protein PBC10988_36930 [Planctomycetales bacterium 10988]|nr:Hypothetical protein PBC10988_36930 [Planctomycetales bacterium 10988]
MRALLLLSFCLCLFSFPMDVKAEERTLPLIEEQVDEIIIVRTVGNQYARVVFIRDQNVLASRLLLDEMVWTMEDGNFRLMWQDYSTAERVVEAPKFSYLLAQENPTSNQGAPWWCMERNMRNLKQPERED